MAVKVILNRILVKPIEFKDTHKVAGTDLEIALAFGSEMERKRQEAARVEGHVISIGETAYKDIGDGTSPIKVGDHVVFGKYAGFYVTDPETNEDLVLLNDEDVLCVITGGK